MGQLSNLCDHFKDAKAISPSDAADVHMALELCASGAITLGSEAVRNLMIAAIAFKSAAFAEHLELENRTRAHELRSKVDPEPEKYRVALLLKRAQLKILGILGEEDDIQTNVQQALQELERTREAIYESVERVSDTDIADLTTVAHRIAEQLHIELLSFRMQRDGSVRYHTIKNSSEDRELFERELSGCTSTPLRFSGARFED